MEFMGYYLLSLPYLIFNVQIETCIPEGSSNACSDYNGRLTFFLGDVDKQDIAENVALWTVKEVIESASMISDVGQGLVKITYNGPEPIEPYAVRDLDASSNMTDASIAVLAAGGLTALAFLAIMYVWRKKLGKNGTSMVLHEGETTLAGGGSPGAGDGIDEENGPSSPFSAMLPSTYRYSENMSIISGQEGLSAVTEVSESDGTPSIGHALSGSSPDSHVNEKVVFDFPKSLGGQSPNSSNGDRSVGSNGETNETSPLKLCGVAQNSSLLAGLTSPIRNKEDDVLLFLCD